MLIAARRSRPLLARKVFQLDRHQYEFDGNLPVGDFRRLEAYPAGETPQDSVRGAELHCSPPHVHACDRSRKRACQCACSPVHLSVTCQTLLVREDLQAAANVVNRVAQLAGGKIDMRANLGWGRGAVEQAKSSVEELKRIA